MSIFCIVTYQLLFFLAASGPLKKCYDYQHENAERIYALPQKEIWYTETNFEANRIMKSDISMNMGSVGTTIKPTTFMMNYFYNERLKISKRGSSKHTKGKTSL